MYTANVYREIRLREFQICGDCMLPTIPVIFEINTLCGLLLIMIFFKFSYNFCGDFRLPVILVKFICMLRGIPCGTGISYTIYRGKICSVVNPYRFKNILSVKKLFLTAKSLSVEFMERVVKFKVLFVLSITVGPHSTLSLCPGKM